MAKSTNGRQSSASPAFRPITAISVEGFKSIDARQEIEVRPLTILAGVNSSGKSSMMQPLLLLKQTLEAPYDPGPLLLNGPNAKFTKIEQLLCRAKTAIKPGIFAFGMTIDGGDNCQIYFRRGSSNPVELDHISIGANNRVRHIQEGEFDLSLDMALVTFPKETAEQIVKSKARVRLTRKRFNLLQTIISSKHEWVDGLSFGSGIEKSERSIFSIIHVPGLRGNPQRNYPLTAVGDRFPGTFEEYVAAVIAVKKGDEGFMGHLGSDMRELGLTWKVEARAVDDTQVELRVGRLADARPGGAHDMVSIADVGFGVSQTLPVVVALLTAKPGQMVYIEQPEIHLHPRAQHAMAKLLARAAMRGVQVVIETHSSILLLGIQSLVATGELDPAKVKLHWFQRDGKTGATTVSSADLDAAGSFGDWPEDFDDVSLFAQQRYLDAAEKMLSHEP